MTEFQREVYRAGIYSVLYLKFLGNEELIEKWMDTKNPLLGGLKPNDMIALEREEKLFKQLYAEINGDTP